MEVYLDNAATTPIAPEVLEAMIPVLRDDFGNPSSAHAFGRRTKALIETSRRSIAKHLNCQSSEIIFTSGGTEADNMAIRSAIELEGVTHIITSRIEHHAVGHTDKRGNVQMDDLERLLKEDGKAIVCLMHANNEIATLLPLEKVSQLCRRYNALFHSDTVQTMGHYTFDMQALDIDYITCAAHKFHGPKGSGFLYIKNQTKAGSLIHGGAQERGLRGGTENVYGIVGLAKAMDLAYADLPEHRRHVQGLKTHMIDELTKYFGDIQIHGEVDPDKALYTVLNVCFPKTDKASMLLFTLDLKGVAVSGGSACSSGAAVGSHVLLGINADMTRPNVRFSFSRYTTLAEVNYALEQIKVVFEKTLA
jgi:cysteine desulfurase